MTRQAAHIPGWVIRPYRAADQAAVDDLVEGGADPLWVSQGHRLHGEAREGDRWRRSLVAEEAGRVVGAVTIGRNPVHPGRYNAAVEVAVGSRRRGLGTALIEQVRLLAPEARPLAGKLRPSDAAAVALAERLGGRVYQRCPGPCPDPTRGRGLLVRAQHPGGRR